MRAHGIRHASAYPEVSPRVEGSDADAVEDDRRESMGEPPVCRALVHGLDAWSMLHGAGWVYFFNYHVPDPWDDWYAWGAWYDYAQRHGL